MYAKVTLHLILATGLMAIVTQARPQFNFGNLFRPPQAPQANLATGAAAGGALLTGVLALNNIRNGNDEIRFKPQINLLYNPETGGFEPALTGNVQVGTGVGSTSLGVGGTLSEGQIAPIATTSIHGPNLGNVATPAVTSGFVFKEHATQAVGGVGGSTDALSFSPGKVSGLLSGRRRRSVPQYAQVVYYY